MRKTLLTAAALGVLMTAAVQGAAHADPVTIDEIILSGDEPAAGTGETLAAAKAFYQFWNDGDEATLKRAIAPTFTDHTLPAGRPQGPEGPAFASRTFRKAVPDLKVEVKTMIVAGDYVTVHMLFTGHFTGSFGKAEGKGQPIDFIATDLIKIADGHITDNWHIEDNLTLLAKMGIATVSF